jgi:hypothetical protein
MGFNLVRGIHGNTDYDQQGRPTKIEGDIQFADQQMG